MSDLPTELYHEILIRVPAGAYARNGKESLNFRQLHAERQMGSGNMLMFKAFSGDFYSLSLESLDHLPESSTRKIEVAYIGDDKGVNPESVHAMA